MIQQQFKPLTVVQISDTHLYARPGGEIYGVDVDRGLSAVLGHIERRRYPLDFILATGDLVQDEGVRAYRRFRSLLEPLEVPVYCLPGNHDSPSVMNDVLATGSVRRVRHVIHGVWHFVLLDSTLPGSTGGHLADSELAFLDATLHAYPEHYAVVCLHHHPLPIDSAWLDTMVVDNGSALFTVLDRHPRVRAVIWGHIHQEYSIRRRGADLLGTPSTCAQFVPGLKQPATDNRPPGYRWFQLYPDGGLATGVERVERQLSAD